MSNTRLCVQCMGEMSYSVQDLCWGCYRCQKAYAKEERDATAEDVVKSKKCVMCLNTFVTDGGGQNICKSCQKVADDVKEGRIGPDVHAEVDELTDELHKRQALRAKAAEPKTATEIMNEQRADIAAQKRRHTAEIVDLNTKTPTVASVISRIVRHQHEIKNLIVFIEYKNKPCQVTYNTMTEEMLCYGGMAVTRSIARVTFGELDGG